MSDKTELEIHLLSLSRADRLESSGKVQSLLRQASDEIQRLRAENVRLSEAEAAARLEEREACAMEVETIGGSWRSSSDLMAAAGAIRARSEGCGAAR